MPAKRVQELFVLLNMWILIQRKRIFQLLGYYLDDGWSGTNFDRPDFQRMIDDIEDGKINCVVTKDYCAIIGLNQKDLENQGILA